VKPKNKNMDEHDAVISIRLTRGQHEELKALAARESRTVSQQVRHLVAAAIDHEHAPAA
jgi:predicted DNA-binding protein